MRLSELVRFWAQSGRVQYSVVPAGNRNGASPLVQSDRCIYLASIGVRSWRATAVLCIAAVRGGRWSALPGSFRPRDLLNRGKLRFGRFAVTGRTENRAEQFPTRCSRFRALNEGVQVPRYFFHLLYRDRNLRDAKGYEFEDDASARREGLVSLGDMLAEAGRSLPMPFNVTVQVVRQGVGVVHVLAGHLNDRAPPR